MAKFSVIFLLALVANVLAQTTTEAPATAIPPIVHTGTAPTDGGDALIAGGTGAGTGTGTGTGTAASATGSGTGTETAVASVITTNEVETVINSTVIPAKTVTGSDGSKSTIAASTVVETNLETRAVTKTENAGASSTAWANPAARADLGLVAGFVIFLAAGL